MEWQKAVIWVVIAVAVVAVGFSLTRPAGPVNKNIGNRELAKLKEQGARLVDVRTQAEYLAGHIPGAEPAPIDSFPSAFESWDKSAPVIVYCATGARSAQAAQMLADAGFQRVYNLKSGLVAWNGEVTKDTGGGGTVDTGGKPGVVAFMSDS
jgi:rhodanese-related sulfurtransferase